MEETTPEWYVFALVAYLTYGVIYLLTLWMTLFTWRELRKIEIKLYFLLWSIPAIPIWIVLILADIMIRRPLSWIFEKLNVTVWKLEVKEDGDGERDS